MPALHNVVLEKISSLNNSHHLVLLNIYHWCSLICSASMSLNDPQCEDQEILQKFSQLSVLSYSGKTSSNTENYGDWRGGGLVEVDLEIEVHRDPQRYGSINVSMLWSHILFTQLCHPSLNTYNRLTISTSLITSFPPPLPLQLHSLFTHQRYRFIYTHLQSKHWWGQINSLEPQHGQYQTYYDLSGPHKKCTLSLSRFTLSDGEPDEDNDLSSPYNAFSSVVMPSYATLSGRARRGHTNRTGSNTISTIVIHLLCALNARAHPHIHPSE